MSEKQKQIKLVYFLPGIVAVVRTLLTLYLLVGDPFDWSLRIIQLFPLGVLAGSCFTFYKMYNDGVPVITLIVPTLLQGVLELLVHKSLTIAPYLLVLMFDACYLTAKGMKANFYPFEVEGDDEEADILSALIEESE